jgi:hypothetical protein
MTGRVSGPLLSENLLRNGENLAFDTSLLFLDVINGYVGIRTDIPTRTLNINSTIVTTNLLVDTQADFASISIFGNTIQNTTGRIYVTPNQASNPLVTVPELQTANLKITSNNILNTVQNNDITISTLGTGKLNVNTTSVHINNNIRVTGLVDITQDAVIHGNVYLGNDVFDMVTLAQSLTQTIKPNANSSYTLGHSGTDPRYWDVAYVKLVDVDGVTQIYNNTISTLTTNTDIRLVASGTGKIVVKTTDVQVNNSLTTIGGITVNGLTTLKTTNINGTTTLVGDITQTGSIDITGTFANNNIVVTNASSYIQVPDIKILNNRISVTATNSDFVFSANGTGGVVLDNMVKFTDTTISNRWLNAVTSAQQGINFNMTGTGAMVINTLFLTIPYASESNSTLTNVGEIRLNSSTNLFEGYLNNGLASFSNLYDTDRNTYITAELTPAANDKIIRFSTNNIINNTIDSSKLSSTNIVVDNIQITSNTISNIQDATDLNFTPSGTGNVNVTGVLFQNSKVINQLNTPLYLTSTGTGYVKFGGTGGIVIPYGNNFQRRLTPEVGEFRYNTQVGYAEVYDGTIWIPAIGGAGLASEEEVDSAMNFMSLIFG